ncbi:LytR family transcriptional attenuator [Humibacillus xanthopallidus]|uniref:LytR family transcriptional attenuator n=1 Tax=Humibacillus xanthopallidus TaxID=412689 RepID=A0A543PLV5_9MICO|nr:LCP family protein [Humibacillus xanthopallidus]TQN45063.1 LytR family transcriptional attenuator [Humibacillus xanthopallidus]
MTDANAPRPRRAAAPSGREAFRRQIKAGFRRSLGLTTLGTVIPGAGLTQTRSKRLGWAILALFLLTGVVVGYIVLRDGITNAALSLVARPSLLQGVAVGFVVIGILWCGSIILTAIQTRPTRLDRTRTRTLAALTTVLVFLVAGSTFKVAEYTLITTDTVNQVFGTTTTAEKSPGQGVQVATEGDDPWANQARVNILLLGSDAGADRTGIRTDSMIVASIDTKSGRTALISMPRNLLYAPLAPDSPLRARYPSGHFGQPESTCSQNSPGVTGQCMLTNLYVEAEGFAKDHPGAYPAGAVAGRQEIRGAVQQILGLQINQMVIVDLYGFQQLIDAMGGLDINVKLSSNGTKLTIGGQHDASGRIFGVKGYFTPGEQHLDGYHALWYARTRAADDDTHRQMRQRCVVQAIVQQVNPASMVSRYPEIAKILKQRIYTDIEAQDLPAFVELVERVQKSKITSVALTSTQGVYSGNPDYDLIRKLVKKAIAAPKPAATPSTTPSTPKPSSTKTKTPTPTTTPYEQC